MIEKHKLEVTFDFEEACDFIRAVYSGHSLDVKKCIEELFTLAKDRPNLTVITAIEHAIKTPGVRTTDFMVGLKNGLFLALAVSRPTERGSIHEFLAHLKKTGKNVTDISEAFRKKQS